MSARHLAVFATLALAAACSEDGGTTIIIPSDSGSGGGSDVALIGDADLTDAGDSDAAEADASDSDASETDVGSDAAATDAGEVDAEADAPTDTGSDTGETDAQTDAVSDTGASDAGDDVGETDTARDSGETDAARDTGETDTGETDSGRDTGETDTSTDAGADTGPLACGEGVTFSGQAFVDADAPAISPNGGFAVFSPYPASYDSGIAEVWAQAPFDDDVTDSTDPERLDVSIGVVEATVIATGANTDASVRAQSQFWIADGRDAVQFFLPFDDESALPPFSVRVGQRISFTALQIGRYRGIPQIYEVEGWTLVSENNEVAFRDIGDDEPLTYDDVPQNIRVTGTITGEIGSCGGSAICYDFTYGDGQRATFRSASSFIEVGDCLTFAGPLGSFAGVPQLDTQNFDWLFDYTRNDAE